MKKLLDFKYPTSTNYENHPFQSDPLKSLLSEYVQGYLNNKSIYNICGFDQDDDLVIKLDSDSVYAILIEAHIRRKIEITIFKYSRCDCFRYDEVEFNDNIKCSKKELIKYLNIVLDYIIKHHIDTKLGIVRELEIVEVEQ